MKSCKYNYSILTFTILAVTMGCSTAKMVSHGGFPDQSDYKNLPQREVHTSTTNFMFNKSEDFNNLGQTVGLNNKDLNSTNVSLNDFVTLHKTIAFLIIRNDTIIYQYYDPKYNDTSLVSSFSLIKPIVTSLIGIAINEGKIKSMDDLIVDYLPEYKTTKGFEKIKIRHLLHHTSGIKFSDGSYNPFSDNADYYWGASLRKKLLDITISEAPELHFRYSSINTLLLGRILEVASQQTVSNYLEEKIWAPLGMESSGFWSLDRADNQGIEKTFCCFQARVKDFARLARLHMHYGNWFGKQIVPEEWIKYSTKPDPSGGNKIFYNNNWGIGPLKYGSFYAIGLYGQLLYIYPEKNIIIVRFGDKDLHYHPNYWTSSMLQIIDQI